MNLINNAAEFEAWKKQEYFERLDMPSPKEYPCYVYTVVSDWGMEESAAVYVYADDLRNMLAAIEAAQQSVNTDGVTGCACVPELPYLLTGGICSECKSPRR